MERVWVTVALMGFGFLALGTFVYFLLRQDTRWRFHNAWVFKRVEGHRYRGPMMRRPKGLFGWEYRFCKPGEDLYEKGSAIGAYVFPRQ